MDERTRRVAKRFEVPILIAALLVVPVFALEQSSAGEPWRAIAGALNWAIWLAFAAELVVMLAVVPSKWDWLREHPIELAVVVLTPPFLPAGLQAVRALRLLRLVRLLRLAPLARRFFSLEGLQYATLLAALTIFASGEAFAYAENVSTWDGVWWSITTMTTVGYGGSPETDLGRVITIAVLIIGIGFVAVLTGAVAERFLASRVDEVIEAEAEIEATDVEVLTELREVRSRLDRLEARLTDRGSG